VTALLVEIARLLPGVPRVLAVAGIGMVTVAPMVASSRGDTV